MSRESRFRGRSHPVQFLEACGRSVNANARVVVVAATGYSIADLSEEGVLGVAGLDAVLPKLITGCIRA